MKARAYVAFEKRNQNWTILKINWTSPQYPGHRASCAHTHTCSTVECQLPPSLGSNSFAARHSKIPIVAYIQQFNNKFLVCGWAWHSTHVKNSSDETMLRSSSATLCYGFAHLFLRFSSYFDLKHGPHRAKHGFVVFCVSVTTSRITLIYNAYNIYTYMCKSNSLLSFLSARVLMYAQCNDLCKWMPVQDYAFYQLDT